MARAYGAFMNGGYRLEPHAVLRIEDARGAVLYDYAAPAREKVLAGRVLADMERLFAASVYEGTSTRAQVEGLTVRGKTGTTNDHRDAWFVGFAGGLVASVWTGNDDGSPTQKAVGGAGPASVFAGFMANAPLPGDFSPSDAAPPARTVEREAEPASPPEDPLGALIERVGGR